MLSVVRYRKFKLQTRFTSFVVRSYMRPLIEELHVSSNLL